MARRTPKHHPLVFFGQCANRTETLIRQQTNSAIQLKCYGLLALLLLLVPLSAGVYLLSQWYWPNILFAPVILYFCIAAKSLRQHANAVFDALDADNLILASFLAWRESEAGLLSPMRVSSPP